MRHLLAILLALTPLHANAQDVVYVQIEAHPDIDDARDRARDYARIVPDVNGFAVSPPWYAIALGPYPEAEARETLSRLRAQGLVPRDSYVTDGGSFRERFWPVGGATDAQTRTPEVDVQAEPSAEPRTPDETPAQARASEAALDRPEREAIQRALEWLGHYDGAIDASFGRGTRAAMAAWQRASGLEPTGILTTAGRSRLLSDYAAEQAALGLEPLAVPEAGLALTAPMGLLAFDRIEAPFVHYEPREAGGMRMSLISAPGDAAALAALYAIMQTVDLVPEAGERSRSEDAFAITGVASDRTTRVVARLEGDRIAGYLLSWPPAQDRIAARALAEMDRTLVSNGPALSPDAGFEPSAQDRDTVSGLDVRRPSRVASGFYVDGSGAAVTTAAHVDGCTRITLGGGPEAEVATSAGGVAVLRPLAPTAPVTVASLATEEGRLGSRIAVAGFPFDGVLGTATLTFGALEDVRGLDGDEAVLRLRLEARDGDRGGPVLDPAGRVTGMLGAGEPGDGRALPRDAAFALKASALARLLADAGIRPRLAEGARAIAPEDLAQRASEMTMLVECWE